MGKVIVVTSGKGGVGKTTSTAALGAENRSSLSSKRAAATLSSRWRRSQMAMLGALASASGPRRALGPRALLRGLAVSVRVGLPHQPGHLFHGEAAVAILIGRDDDVEARRPAGSR